MPKGLSFLSGLPEEKRRQRIIVPIQDWIDESESRGKLSTFTLAGFIGRAEEWAAFSDDWTAALHADPRIPYLSTRQAEGRTSWFRGDKEKRDKKILTLTRTIQPYDFTLVYVSIDLNAYRELYPPVPVPEVSRKTKAYRRLQTLAASPYAFCFLLICTAICNEALDRGVTDRIELFFDEHEIWKPRVRDWWPIFLTSLKPREKAIMPIDPLFRDDKEEMPLQLADLFAWILSADFSMKRHELEWLSKELGPISRATRSGFWSRNAFKQFAANYKQGELEPDMEKAPDQFLGE